METLMRTLIMCLFTLLLSAGASCAGEVTVYPVPDQYTGSTFEVTVDGKKVPIEKAGQYMGCYYARFEYTGKVRCSVSYHSTGATSFDMKPEYEESNIKWENDVVSFDIEEPGARVMRFTCGSMQQWPLIILAEKVGEHAPAPDGSGVIVIDGTDDCDVDHTGAIEKAMDTCREKGGGEVVLGKGFHRTDAFNVPSNTTLYLAPGCVVMGYETPEHYQKDLGQKDVHSRSPDFANNGLVNVINSENVKIYGPGVIEGVGHILRNHNGYHARAMKIVMSRNVTVEDVILRNAASWTFQIFASDKVVANNVKVLADWTVGNTDGINPDCSRDVTISDYFGYCGDDAVAIKATSNSPETGHVKNITVKDCVVFTRKTGYKLGTETFKNIQNVTFDNCHAINSSRGYGLWMRDGGTMSNITFKNSVLDLQEYPGEGKSGQVFLATLSQRNGIGKIENITFENIKAHAPGFLCFWGMQESKITGVTIKDFDLVIKHRTDKMWPHNVIDMDNCKDFRFENVSIDWTDSVDCLWKGLIDERNSEDISFHNVTGIEEYRK